ncbi:hypothetical protein Ancab_005445 [Ancistrocladus abbreviatus]
MALASPFPTNWNSLPSEIQFDILVRVPAFDLSRLKSVCKSWLNLISDSYFVKAQLANTYRNSELSFLIIDENYSQGYDPSHHLGYAIDDDGRTTHHLGYAIDGDGRTTQLYDLKIDLKAVPGVPKESYIHVLSSCDGVILFSASNCYEYSFGYAGQQLFLCNPITRASYRLPSLPVFKKAKHWCASNWLLSHDKKDDKFRVTGLRMKFVPANPNLKHYQLLALHVGRPKWKVQDWITEVFKEPNVVHSNGRLLLSLSKLYLPGSYCYFQGGSYRFCIQSGKMEVWTAKNWDGNCWAKEDVFQLDPLLLSKIAQFDQTVVQPIASRGDKIFLLIGCRNDMHLQLAVLDMRSRKVKPVCFAGEGREFDDKDNISWSTSSYHNMWGDFDILCHVGSLLQLP